MNQHFHALLQCYTAKPMIGNMLQGICTRRWSRANGALVSPPSTAMRNQAGWFLVQKWPVSRLPRCGPLPPINLSLRVSRPTAGPSSANHQSRNARISKTHLPSKLAASSIHLRFAALIYNKARDVITLNSCFARPPSRSRTTAATCPAI